MKKRKSKIHRKRRKMRKQKPRKQSEALVTINEAALYSAMDKLDTDIIMKQLEKTTDKTPFDLAYMFRLKNGKTMSGLSIAGIQDAVRRMAAQGECLRAVSPASIQVVQVPDEGTFVNASIIVSRFVYRRVKGRVQQVELDSATGSKSEPRYIELKKGGSMKDRFWMEKAISKAERNAKRKLIPGDVKARVLAYALEKGLVTTANIEDFGKADNDEAIDVLPAEKSTSCVNFEDSVAWLEMARNARKVLGDKEFSEILETHKFASAGEVRDAKKREIILNDWREMAEALTERDQKVGSRKRGQSAASMF